MTIFRAYDVRGIYGTELTEEIARKIGASFGSYLEGGRITLGRDTRVSGPTLEQSFLEGALFAGTEIDSYGVIPISILSFMTMHEKKSAAAYISASHNPPEYNGIRFRTGEGYGLLYKETPIIDFYKSGCFRKGAGGVARRDPADALRSYAEHVASKVHLGRRLKVVLDTGNGSACGIESLYRTLGFDPVVVNGVMDGRFPGRGPAPTEESLKEASRRVLSECADFGIGFDPDADRGIVIDDRGRVMPPEKVAVILAKRRYRPGDLVISGFDCSMILERELIPFGIRVERERVGDVYVANCVKNSSAVLGVERSGHFFLPEFQYSDDPFAMSMALGEIISGGEKLSDLADTIPDYPYLQKSIRLPEGAGHEDTVKLMKRLLDALAYLEPETKDGIKIFTDTASILIRPSNTEPLVRLYVETAGEDAQALLEKYERLVRATMSPD